MIPIWNYARIRTVIKNIKANVLPFCCKGFLHIFKDIYIYIVTQICPPNRFELEFRVPLPSPPPPPKLQKCITVYDTPYTGKTFRLGNLETVCGLYIIWLLQNEMGTHIINTIFGNIKTTLQFSLYQINFDWPLVFNIFFTWLRNVLSLIINVSQQTAVYWLEFKRK